MTDSYEYRGTQLISHDTSIPFVQLLSTVSPLNVFTNLRAKDALGCRSRKPFGLGIRFHIRPSSASTLSDRLGDLRLGSLRLGGLRDLSTGVVWPHSVEVASGARKRCGFPIGWHVRPLRASSLHSRLGALHDLSASVIWLSIVKVACGAHERFWLRIGCHMRSLRASSLSGRLGALRNLSASVL